MRKLFVFFTGMMLFLQQVQAQQSISINALQISGGNTNCLQMGTPVQQGVWVKNTGSISVSGIVVNMWISGTSQGSMDSLHGTIHPGDSALVSLPYVVPNRSPYYVWVEAYGSGVYDSAFIQECAEIEDLEIGFASPSVDTAGKMTPVEIFVKNYSSIKAYHSMYVYWTINGVMQAPIAFSFVPPLAPLSTRTIVIGFYTAPIGGTTDLKVWIDSQDNYPLNDTTRQIRQVYKPSVQTQISATMCLGNTYQFGNQTLTKAGRYVDSLPSSIAGVDSIVVLTLTVDSAYYKFINASICQGGSYNFRGKTLTTAGFYSDTVLNVSACDSIIVLNLTVIQPKTVSYYGYACQGGSYNFRGQTLTTSGTYYDTLQSMLGCDSIIFTLNLTIDTTPCNATIYVGVINPQDTTKFSTGIAVLYSVQSGVYVLVDTATLNGIMCTFTNVASGDYVIKVIPDSSENALPTYYGNTEFWNLATIINIAYDSSYFAYIQLIPMPSPSNGSSSIKGYVGYEKEHKSISQKSVNFPAENIDVYLQKEESQWTTVAYTLTNAEGYFEFKKISVGKYRVVLDVAGIEMVNIQEIEITNDGENVQIQDYELTEDGIKIKKDVGIVGANNIHPIQVFPNPTSGKLKIESEKLTIKNVEIYDIYGRKLSTFNSQRSTNEIDISHLANGLYFLKVDGKVFKVIKN